MHDLTIYRRKQIEWSGPIGFFALVVSIFAISVGAEPLILQKTGVGIIWLALVLATTMSLDSMLSRDFELGILEQLVLQPYSFSMILLTKACAHWLAIGLPLILVAPILAILLNFPSQSIYVLIASLIIVTPIFSLIGLFGAALTLGLKRGGVLLSILVLPLYFPLIIFGTEAVGASQQNLSVKGHMAFLMALLIIALLFLPFTIATAIKISLADS